MPRPLHEEISEWRKNAKLTQDELAKMVGVQLVTISRWERGLSRPRRSNIEAIKKATQNAVAIAEKPERAAVSELADRHYELAFKVDGLENEILELRERTNELTEVWQRLKELEKRVPPRKSPRASTAEPGTAATTAADLHAAAAADREERLRRRR